MTESRQQRRAHERASAKSDPCAACGAAPRNGAVLRAAIDPTAELRVRPGHDPATPRELAMVRARAVLLNRAGVRLLARRAKRMRSTSAGVLLADVRGVA